ncbi:MAG: sigma-70 family RNA polymerase sigma factor [Firmicutes bacterium]|nr:sigma-70 family RNA polymerase sigma factor [Bacillota bacterium]
MTGAQTVQDALLPEDKTRELLRLAQSGDFYAKETLIRANLRLVHSVVRRYAGLGQDAEDLFQVGCLGLIKAVDQFDLQYPVCFSTYAVPLVLGEIRRYLRDNGPISVSRTLKERAAAVEKTRKALYASLQQEPSLSQIAAALDLSPEQVLLAVQASRPLISLHEPHRHADGSAVDLLARLKDMTLAEDEAILEKLDVERLLAALPPRWSHILKRRYYQDWTQAEVAREMGVSQVQISRLEKKALRQLRREIAAKQEDA